MNKASRVFGSANDRVVELAPDGAFVHPDANDPIHLVRKIDELVSDGYGMAALNPKPENSVGDVLSDPLKGRSPCPFFVFG